MKTIKLLFFVLFFSIFSLQAKTITGTVTDASTGEPLPGVNIVIKGTNTGAVTDFDGKYTIEAQRGDVLVFSFLGYKTKTKKVGKSDIINVKLKEDGNTLQDVVISAVSVKRVKKSMGYSVRRIPPVNTESYTKIKENGFQLTKNKPLSTFSIDVDKAAYSNIRRMINNGEDIPKDAVKIEEMINYFDYEYPQPDGEHPFSINTEVGKCPWNEKHKLVKIGLQGKIIPQDDLPPANLVFLLDVSGSMYDQNKLPLLKKSFKLLVNQLREQDKVSIVVYAGAAGVVLRPTPGNKKQKILEALDKLEAGGSTAGGEGLILAYKLAKENFIKNGNNRVIMATDGDFNTGRHISDSDMEDLIVEQRKSGVFLTVLGFGMGNYKDSKLETLADKGNGNHAYIDTMQEANKVFGKEFGGTLFTIAKDVKIQVEFNPEKVQAYRLIGYENRLLNDEDFIDDKIDAGEIGSGHTVTALYEIIPAGVASEFVKKIPELKYSEIKASGKFNDELLTVKVRYKKPDKDKSIEIVTVVPDKENLKPGNDFNFAASVAMFGMLLRDSEYKQDATYQKVHDLAQKSKGKDKDGYRSEFVRLVETFL